MKSVKHMGFLTFNQSVAFFWEKVTYFTAWQFWGSARRDHLVWTFAQRQLVNARQSSSDESLLRLKLHSATLKTHSSYSRRPSPKCDNKKPLCCSDKKKVRFDKRKDSRWGGCWSEIIGLDSSFPFHTEEGVLLPRFGFVHLETENEYAVGWDKYTKISLANTFITLLLAYTLAACWQI